MEEPKIVTYHHLAKIGIRDIFYHYDADGKKEKWKFDEKCIETIDGQQWDYDKDTNLYTLRALKLETV